MVQIIRYTIYFVYTKYGNKSQNSLQNLYQHIVQYKTALQRLVCAYW